MAGCSDQSDVSSTNHSGQVKAVDQPLAADATSHLLVIASYENGVFKAETVTRVPGLFAQPRGGQQRGTLAYLARKGTGTVALGGLPDPREVHLDSMEAGSNKMQKVSTPAPGKQHFIIHVPESTDAVDFFEASARKSAVMSQRPNTTFAARPSLTGAPVGSISLAGLL